MPYRPREERESERIHAAAIAARGTSVFAYKGETLSEYWDFTHRVFDWPQGAQANLILDDGGPFGDSLSLGRLARAIGQAGER